MHRKVAAMVAAALALSLGAAGCGGDDALTRAELVKQAGAACKKGQTQPANAGDAKRSYVEFARDGLARQEAMVDELDELVPPEELATRYDDFVAALRSLNEVTGEALDEFAAAEGGDAQVSPALISKRDKLATTAAELAGELGLEVCSG